MQLAFILTMPNRGSWNGGWSGEGDLYCIVKSFTTRKEIAKAEEMIAKRNFYYSWSDGWGANIEVKAVDHSESAKLQKKSKGFCGYDWMVNTIILYGKALADHEIDEYLKRVKEKETTNAAS